MSTPKEIARLSTFLHVVGIDPDGNRFGTLMELMNLALQCLGAVRIVSSEIERERLIRLSTSIDKQVEIDEEGFAQWSIRKTFSFAVRRMLQHILKADHPHNLDPARHIIESFPTETTVFNQGWLAAHWAVLGDPDVHEFIPDYAKSGEQGDPASNQSEASGNLQFVPEIDDANSKALDAIANDAEGKAEDIIEDERLSIMHHLVPFQPSTVAEVDLEGRTVLHIAARLESVPLFKCVLKQCRIFNGATLDKPNLNGALPLHNSARFSCSKEIFDIVRQSCPQALRALNNDGMLPLHWAAAKNRNVDIIRSLIELGDPDDTKLANIEGCLPLHLAGQNDSLEVVQTIYETFPEAIRIRDHEGGLPLHHACCLVENELVVKYLHEAYPEAISIAQDETRCTPLHLAAAFNSSPDIIRYILSVCPNGASVEDADGWCAVHSLLNTNSEDRWDGRKLECLRILLRENPQVRGVYQQSQYDAVARTILRFQRDEDIVRYRELNWRARGVMVRLLVYFARPMVDIDWSGILRHGRFYHTIRKLVLNDSKPIKEREDLKSIWQDVIRSAEQDERRFLVLYKLVERFMSPGSLLIPSGVLRKIILFL
eukprot:gene444-478_t